MSEQVDLTEVLGKMRQVSFKLCGFAHFMSDAYPQGELAVQDVEEFKNFAEFLHGVTVDLHAALVEQHHKNSGTACDIS